MSCSKFGGGGCVLKYDSAENKVRSESNVVMVEQRQALIGARALISGYGYSGKALSSESGHRMQDTVI